MKWYNGREVTEGELDGGMVQWQEGQLDDEMVQWAG